MVPVDSLMALNKMTSSRVSPGQQIWVPIQKVKTTPVPVQAVPAPAPKVTNSAFRFPVAPKAHYNIAVFLPRQLDVSLMIMISVVFVGGLGIMLKSGGGKIQQIVLEKHNTRYVRSATIIDLVYFVILYFFKELNDIPMSTTWVFVGLLCGRELAISTMNKEYKFKYVFPLIGKDFIKMIFGLSVSVGIVLAIHYIIIPNNWF